MTRAFALRARRRAHREDGAALVELAVCLTLLIVIAFGIVEFGNAWNRKLEVETAARAGARVGSSLGSDRLADQGLLQSIVSVLNDFGLDNVNYVVVFKPTAAGKRQGTCASSPPVAQSGLCNVYDTTQLKNLSSLNFTTSSSTCSASAVDKSWCPTTRKNTQSAGTDFIGVYVQANYVTATGLFKSPFSLASSAVMRVEPCRKAPCT
jgi:Flp pilus assembly protein TadG